jgi:hypothetical protein
MPVMTVHSLMRSEIMDDATCDVCQLLDGIVRPADDPAWAGELGMPAHCNCRFTIIALLEGIDPVLDPTPDAEMPDLATLFGMTMTPAMIESLRIPIRGADRFQTRELTIEDIEDLLGPGDLIARLFERWRWN